MNIHTFPEFNWKYLTQFEYDWTTNRWILIEFRNLAEYKTEQTSYRRESKRFYGNRLKMIKSQKMLKLQFSMNI